MLSEKMTQNNPEKHILLCLIWHCSSSVCYSAQLSLHLSNAVSELPNSRRTNTALVSCLITLWLGLLSSGSHSLSPLFFQVSCAFCRKASPRAMICELVLCYWSVPQIVPYQKVCLQIFLELLTIVLHRLLPYHLPSSSSKDEHWMLPEDCIQLPSSFVLGIDRSSCFLPGEVKFTDQWISEN